MNEIKVSLVTGHPNEKWACHQLLRLLEQYDLGRWRFTDRVQIQHLAMAHSHPILTLNSRYLADDNAALSTYLHEQLHWFSLRHADEMDRADAELRKRYPTVPSFDAGGARSDDSTYLHLAVCALEYKSLGEVIGREEATSTIERLSPYQWIYYTILSEWPYFEDLLQRNGLQVP